MFLSAIQEALSSLSLTRSHNFFLVIGICMQLCTVVQIPALCLSRVNTSLSHQWYQIQQAFDVIKFHRVSNFEFLHVVSIHTSFIFAVTLLCPCHSSYLDLSAWFSNTEPPVNDDTHFPLWFLQPHSWSSLNQNMAMQSTPPQEFSDT